MIAFESTVCDIVLVDTVRTCQANTTYMCDIIAFESTSNITQMLNVLNVERLIPLHI